MKKVKIGFCGQGTVGGGAIKILEDQREKFNHLGWDIEIAKILVKDVSKKRSDLPRNAEIVDDYKSIIDDETIDIVVEAIGGLGLAKKIVLEALDNGKSVVTANKALIADNLLVLKDKLDKNPQLKLCFEASVGGGIPLISTLQTNFLSDKITQISGILNGTTNFIISKMAEEDMDYPVALKEAQDLGFAEADPSSDVDGFDARSKIVILTQQGTGFLVKESEVFMQGIGGLEAIDFLHGKLLDATIKPLGVSMIKDSQVSAFVSPCMVKNKNIFSRIHNSSNGVCIDSEFQERTMLIGQGAGSMPTGNSIVTDILQILENPGLTSFPDVKVCQFNPNFEACFYIRFWVKDQLGIIEKVGALCRENNISIDSILQLPWDNSQKLPFILVTNSSFLKNIQDLCQEVKKHSFCIQDPFFMPIFD